MSVKNVKRRQKACRMPLPNGTFILLDEVDYERSKNREIGIFHGFVCLKARNTEHPEIVRLVPLHRLLLGRTDESDVVFRNGNRRDLRRSNLAFVSSEPQPSILPVRQGKSKNAKWIPELSAWVPGWQGKGGRWQQMLNVQLFSRERDASAAHRRWQVEQIESERAAAGPTKRFPVKPPSPPASANALPERSVKHEKRQKVALYWDDAPTKATWGQQRNVSSSRLLQVAILYLSMKRGDGVCDLDLSYVENAMLGLSQKTILTALETLESGSVVKVERRQLHAAKRLPSRCTLITPSTEGRHGLFPARLFDEKAFRDLNETSKAVLVTLYMMAEGESRCEFKRQELITRACLKSPEATQAALKALEAAGFINLKNPCGPKKPYSSHNLVVDLLW